MDPLRIAVCEDREDDARILKYMLEKSADGACVECFSSGEDFISVGPAGRYHLVFLDIYMGSMTGVETAQRLREADQDVAIVFTTTSEDHALEGFRVNAMQYLVKPVEEAGVRDVLLRVRRQLDAVGGSSLPIAINGRRRDFSFKDIQYIEVYNKVCLIHLPGEVVETPSTIDDLASLLPDSFLRCHRSYVVNLAYVAGIDRDFIMKNGDIVYIRRGDVKRCADTYKEYLLDAAAGGDIK